MKVNHGVTLCLFLWFNFPVNIFSISSGRNNRVLQLYTEQYYEELMCLALGQNDSEDLDMESHYENTPMQYTENFLDVKMKNFDIFLSFGAKIRKIGIPRIAQFFRIKVGFKGVYISRTCFPDADALPVGHAPPLGELLTIMKNGTHCQLDVHCWV